MPLQSVEAVFDPETDAEVRRRWRVLADAGLPSQAGHGSSSNAPHLTLSAAAEMPAGVEAALVDVATGTGAMPLGCRLGPVVVFGGRRLVVALLVVPSTALVRLHAEVDTAMAAASGVPDRARPGLWTPHVTLARGVASEQIGPVLETLTPIDEREVTITALRRWNPTLQRVWTVGELDRPADEPAAEPTMEA